MLTCRYILIVICISQYDNSVSLKVCCPSRGEMLTGRYLHNLRAPNVRTSACSWWSSCLSWHEPMVRELARYVHTGKCKDMHASRCQAWLSRARLYFEASWKRVRCTHVCSCTCLSSTMLTYWWDAFLSMFTWQNRSDRYATLMAGKYLNGKAVSLCPDPARPNKIVPKPSVWDRYFAMCPDTCYVNCFFSDNSRR